MSDDGYCPACGEYMPLTLDETRRVHGCDRTPPLDGLPPTIYACPVCAGHGLYRWGCWGTEANPHPHAYMKPIHELILVAVTGEPVREFALGARVRHEIMRDVHVERDRQDAKWGGVPGLQRRDDHTYAAVLTEEVGEAAKAWLERDTEALRLELIQVAAVAIAWVEELDNGGARVREAQR